MGGPLQALVVLDYRLIIVERTAAVVQLGRRGGGLVSAPLILSIPNLLCSDSIYNDSRQPECIGPVKQL